MIALQKVKANPMCVYINIYIYIYIYILNSALAWKGRNSAFVLNWEIRNNWGVEGHFVGERLKSLEKFQYLA